MNIFNITHIININKIINRINISKIPNVMKMIHPEDHCTEQRPLASSGKYSFQGDAARICALLFTPSCTVRGNCGFRV